MLTDTCVDSFLWLYKHLTTVIRIHLLSTKDVWAKCPVNPSGICLDIQDESGWLKDKQAEFSFTFFS